MSATVTPDLTFENVQLGDLLDGVATIRVSNHISKVLISPPGGGPDKLMEWALREVGTASAPPAGEDPSRYRINAISHAKRALICLVDWYMERDMAFLCRDAPRDARKQVQFLTKRGIVDSLTGRVLERAIKLRNDVEHQYRDPSIEDIEDAVELLRRTTTALRLHSTPDYGPWIYGMFLYSQGTGHGRNYAEFRGWREPLVVFSRFSEKPWVGVVLPETPAKATVRRTSLSTISAGDLCELLNLVEQRFPMQGGAASPVYSKLLSSAMGF